MKTVLLRVIRFVSAWYRATANRNRGFLKLELVILVAMATVKECTIWCKCRVHLESAVEH